MAKPMAARMAELEQRTTNIEIDNATYCKYTDRQLKKIESRLSTAESVFSVTEKEAELLQYYRMLDGEEKRRMLRVMAALQTEVPF